MGRDIFFALDESSHSIGALNWAFEFMVKSPEDTLTVVVAISSETERDPTISRIKTLLRATAESYTTQPSLAIRIVVSSQPGVAICKLIDEVKPAMLVLGSAGKSHMEGFMVGSVSQYCIAHANCPVIVARLTPADERGRLGVPSNSNLRALSPKIL